MWQTRQVFTAALFFKAVNSLGTSFSHWLQGKGEIDQFDPEPCLHWNRNRNNGRFAGTTILLTWGKVAQRQVELGQFMVIFPFFCRYLVSIQDLPKFEGKKVAFWGGSVSAIPSNFRCLRPRAAALSGRSRSRHDDCCGDCRAVVPGGSGVRRREFVRCGRSPFWAEGVFHHGKSQRGQS